MAEPHSYSEKETTAILRRALELQNRTRLAPRDPRGLTLDGLVAVGREAGIDPAFIREAAQWLTTGRRWKSGWLGAPQSLHLEAVIDRQVNEDQLKDLQIQMGAILKGAGNGLVHRGQFAWDAQPHASSQNLPWRLHVGPDGDRSLATLEVDLTIWAWGLHGGLLGGLGVGVGIGGGVAISVATGNAIGAGVAIPLAFAGAWFLAWLLYRGAYSWAEREGRTVLDQVTAVLTRG